MFNQALTYLGVDTDAAYKKRKEFGENHTYQENDNYVISLIDAEFILYDVANPANFVVIVDGDHEVFTPDISNAVDDDDCSKEEVEEEEEEEWSELTSPSSGPSHTHVDAPSDTGSNNNHQDEIEDTSPAIQWLRDIINDNDYDKYSSYSEINIT